MRTLVLVFLLAVEGIVAQTVPPGPALSTVRYFITFYPVPATPGAKLPPETQQLLMRCLFGRCTMEKQAAAPECPAKSVCENVVIKEARATNGSGYVYTIKNWLTSNAMHVQMFSTKAPQLDYHTVSDVDDARARALERIRLKILCHDQTAHNKREVVMAGIINQPQIEHDCECNPRP